MKRRAAIVLLCSALALSSGCATYVHPERAAVPVRHRGPVDGMMIFLNILFTGGLGLFLDFAHGTIYLPREDYFGPGGNAEFPPVPKNPKADE